MSLPGSNLRLPRADNRLDSDSSERGVQAHFTLRRRMEVEGLKDEFRAK